MAGIDRMRALIVSIAVLVAGCGFSPMYGRTANGPAIGPVQVSQIDGKAGHVLRNELTRILAPEDDGGPPMQLDITLYEGVTPLGIRIDESATRAELRLVANYVLTPPTGEVIRGSVNTVVNYDIPRGSFGEITAQDDARERAAETMAQRFRAELAIRMAQRRSRHT